MLNRAGLNLNEKHAVNQDESHADGSGITKLLFAGGRKPKICKEHGKSQTQNQKLMC
jgi:hypothetical protein